MAWTDRSLKGVSERHWWHLHSRRPFLPDVYRLLSDEEWLLLCQWFEDTDRTFGPGECSVPAASLLTAVVNANEIDSVVQIGHYTGYSAILLGLAMKRMGGGRLVSIDIDDVVTEYANVWIRRFGLEEIVSLIVRDSTSEDTVHDVISLLGSPPRMIFVDSSHEFSQTTRELQLWYPHLHPGGLMIFHDSSEFAQSWDPTRLGGVRGGINDWFHARRESPNMVNLNSDFHGRNQQGRADLTYVDGCGLAIIQSPLSSRLGSETADPATSAN